MRSIMLPLLALALGPAATCSATPPCGWEGTLLNFSSSMGFKATGVISPARSCIGSSATAWAGGAAFGFYSAAGNECDNVAALAPDEGEPVGISSDTDIGEPCRGDCVAAQMDTLGGGSYPGDWNAAGLARVGCLFNNPYILETACSGGMYAFDGTLRTLPPECEARGSKSTLAAGFGSSMVAATYEFDDYTTMTFSIDAGVEAHLTQMVTQCSAGLVTPTPKPWISFFRVNLSSPGQSTTSWQFLIAVDDTGQMTRLGAAQDDDFDYVQDGADWSIDGTHQFSNAAQISGEEISVELYSLSDTDLIGDINGDRAVDRCELISWMSLYGTDFGDADYTPQADVNLDGTIDGDDTQMAWESMCRGDFNCSGSIDQDDVDALIDEVAGSGVLADVNLDGNVDQTDVSALIDAIADDGCP